MRLTSLLILLLSIVSIDTIGQRLLLVPNDTIIHADTVDSPFSTVRLKGSIVNNDTVDVQVNWERVDEDIPVSWETFYCDKNNCYSLNSFPSNNYTLVAGDSADGKAQFGRSTDPQYQMWGTGTGILKIKKWVDGDSANTAITAYYEAYIFADSSNFTPVNSIFNVATNKAVAYPNPVIDIINVELEQVDAATQVEIFTIEGRLAARLNDFKTSGNAISIDLSHMLSGQYLIRALDKNANVIGQAQFSK